MRNLRFRPRAALASLLLTLAVLAVSTTAATARTLTCASAAPKHQFPLKISNGSCALARAVDRYSGSHETVDGSFYVDKRPWVGTIYSRAHGYTYYNFVSPGRVPVSIWITVNIGVS